MQGKQQQQRLFQDLIAYEKEVKDVLVVLGLMSSSACSEVIQGLRLVKNICLSHGVVCHCFERLHMFSFFCPVLTHSIFQVLEQLKEKALKRAGLTEEQVQEKIEERTLARKNKEYEKSDMIRQELYAKGIALMDEAKGTTWRPCESPE